MTDKARQFWRHVGTGLVLGDLKVEGECTITFHNPQLIKHLQARQEKISRRWLIIDKILKRVVLQDDGCYIWTGPTSGNGRGGGYGRMNLDGHTVSVHRTMYAAIHGPIPGKKQIDHTCCNRLCCNPNHLEMVTHKQNQRRKK